MTGDGVAWVIGSGGLLGSSVEKTLRADGWTTLSGVRIRWSDSAAQSDLEAGLEKFRTLVGEGQWAIYWCAGAAVTSSTPEMAEAEALTFRTFLDNLAAFDANILKRGVVFLASSAGGVYGGSESAPFDETSTPAPLGVYGMAKLRAEDTLRAFAATRPIRAVIGRISNLYGPGQNLSKSQGLISRLCLSAVTREPVTIYVPLDTLRDYLYVDDCARLAVDTVARARLAETGVHTKILASGRSVTVSGLIRQFMWLKGANPLIIMSSSPSGSAQGKDIRLRSRYWPELDRRTTVGLPDGMARTLRDMTIRHNLGSAHVPGRVAR